MQAYVESYLIFRNAKFGDQVFTEVCHAADASKLVEMFDVLVISVEILISVTKPLGLEVNIDKTMFQTIAP